MTTLLFTITQITALHHGLDQGNSLLGASCWLPKVKDSPTQAEVEKSACQSPIPISSLQVHTPRCSSFSFGLSCGVLVPQCRSPIRLEAKLLPIIGSTGDSRSLEKVWIRLERLTLVMEKQNILWNSRVGTLSLQIRHPAQSTWSWAASDLKSTLYITMWDRVWWPHPEFFRNTERGAAP